MLPVSIILLYLLFFSCMRLNASQMHDLYLPKSSFAVAFEKRYSGVSIKNSTGRLLTQEQISDLLAFKDEEGNTILHFMQHPHYDWLMKQKRAGYLVKTLLENGAQLEARNLDSLTPFEKAASLAHVIPYADYMAQLLHRDGAKPNGRATILSSHDNGTLFHAPFIIRLLMNHKPPLTYNSIAAINKLVDSTTKNEDAIQIDDINAPAIAYRFAGDAHEINSLQQDGWQLASKEYQQQYDLPLHDTCALMVNPALNTTTMEYTLATMDNMTEKNLFNPAIFFLQHIYEKIADEDKKYAFVQQTFDAAKSFKNHDMVWHMLTCKPWRTLLALLATPTDDACSIMESEIKSYIKSALKHDQEDKGAYMRHSLKMLVHDPIPELQTPVMIHIIRTAHELANAGMVVDPSNIIGAVLNKNGAPLAVTDAQGRTPQQLASDLNLAVTLWGLESD